MFSKPMTGKEARLLEKWLSGVSTVSITCHVKPDGDAVGSTLALWHVLNNMGVKTYVITPDTPPNYLRFLPGFKDIVVFSTAKDFASELLNSSDIIFCLDFNALYRVDRMEETLRNASAKKVLIDHHLDPEDFVDLQISSPADSSTCLLLYKVLCCTGLKPLVDKETAMCLAAGMMTDTGNFSYNANDPDAYRIMAELLSTGIDKVAIWNLLNIKSENQLRLNGYCMEEKMEIFHEYSTSLIQVTKAELDKFDYQKGDLEGVVNQPLQIPNVRVSVLMHQEPDFVKVSMRSQGDIPVNKICEKYFGGGGHLNAAGGEYKGTMEKARVTLIQALEDFKDYIKK